MLLPRIQDREHYAHLFERDELWLPAMEFLAQKHGLQGMPVRGVRGSHLVYRAGKAWIKLMAPLFARDMAFEIAGLRCVQGKLQVPVPEILGQGELEGWPYVILSHIEGERIGDMFFKASEPLQRSLVVDIAAVTKTLHAVEANPTVKERGVWNAFIRERRGPWLLEHHGKKKLADGWLHALPSFVEKFQAEEFFHPDPVFLHADLTHDHFLVKDGRVSGLIDLADCRLGHPEYECVATAVFLLKGKRPLLSLYLAAMGVQNLDQHFSEKLLAWTSLHLFSDLTGYFSDEMKQLPPGDFEGLAAKVFPL